MAAPIALVLGAGISTIVGAAPIEYTDKATFLAAAGTTTTYGFEVHNLVENDFGFPPATTSPVAASDLDNSFDFAFTNLNGISIVYDPTASDPGIVDGTHFLYTHSQAGNQNYTLTLSNFHGSNAAITAFGFTITDFASNIVIPATITYDAGGVTGTLLTVPAGQPDYTQNFLGLTVDPGDAFTSITITLDDVTSGFQDFDQFIFSGAQQRTPEPGTLALLAAVALGGLATRRRRGVA